MARCLSESWVAPPLYNYRDEGSNPDRNLELPYQALRSDIACHEFRWLTRDLSLSTSDLTQNHIRDKMSRRGKLSLSVSKNPYD